MLGDSSKTTIGREGCLLLAMREAGVRCGGVVVDVVPLNAAGRRRLAFAGAAMRIPKMAPLVGMAENGARVVSPASHEVLRSAIVSALEPADGVALLWVDRDRTVPDKDERGKHWVLALGIEPPATPEARAAIVCTDSAIGDFVRLDAETLDGVAKWGEGDFRRYSVREVVPLRRLPRTR
jgi:hypothetical protein